MYVLTHVSTIEKIYIIKMYVVPDVVDQFIHA